MCVQKVARQEPILTDPKALAGLGNQNPEPPNEFKPVGSGKSQRVFCWNKEVMNGRRIESYIHSDNSTLNKGGCLIEVLSETDFASKTPQFITFAKNLAKYAYGIGTGNLAEIFTNFPHVGIQHQELEAMLKEKVDTGDFVCLPRPKVVETTSYCGCIESKSNKLDEKKLNGDADLLVVEIIESN